MSAFPSTWHRWARRSASGGEFCHVDAHEPSDYHLEEPNRDTGKMIGKRACGICFPPAQAEPIMAERRQRILARLAEDAADDAAAEAAEAAS